MLQIGPRSYDLVRGQSGFHLILDPSETSDFWQQRWLFHAHYVPNEADPGPASLPAPWEYLHLMINPLWLSLTDWRDLTTYNPTDHDVGGFYPCSATLSNLIGTQRDGGETIDPGEFRIIRRQGYLFTCEFEGEIDSETPEETGEEHLQLRDEIPFASITVRVPINSADPVTAARATAARALGLTEVARTHLTPYQPQEGRHYRTLGRDNITSYWKLPGAQKRLKLRDA